MARPQPRTRLTRPDSFATPVPGTPIPAGQFSDQTLNTAALAQHRGAAALLVEAKRVGTDRAALAGRLGVEEAKLGRQLDGRGWATAEDLAAWTVLTAILGGAQKQARRAGAGGPANAGDINAWTGTIWAGDCLDLMAHMPAGKVNMILADLPYGTTRNKWDSVIDLDELWTAYDHVLAPGGVIVLTAAQPFTSTLVMSRPDIFKYEWIWAKTIGSGQLNIAHQPLRTHESVLVFAHGRAPYNPQMEPGTPYAINRKTGAWTGRGYNDQADHSSVNTGVRWPKTVQLVPNPRITGGHPTQKPVALFDYLIRTYTDVGQIVLDNVIGSGTTAEAAIVTGRRWIGMDTDAGYIASANARITALLAQTTIGADTA